MNSQEDPLSAYEKSLLEQADNSLAVQRDAARKAMEKSWVLRGRKVNEPLYDARSKVRRSEAWFIAGLVLVSAVAYVIAYLTLRDLITRVPQQGFQISDTAQIITAVSTLTTAIAAGIAAILKAYALLMEARADIIRARAGLPPANEPSAQPSEGDPLV
ncbi:hypothetical protein [Streptomyces xanthophaeus]